MNKDEAIKAISDMSLDEIAKHVHSRRYETLEKRWSEWITEASGMPEYMFEDCENADDVIRKIKKLSN